MWVIWIVGVIALLVEGAIVGTALGQLWGPPLLTVGFAAWGVLLMLSGLGLSLQVVGVVYLLASVSELAAAWEFWLPASADGPSRSWRVGAALTGVAGALGTLVLLLALAQAIVSAMII